MQNVYFIHSHFSILFLGFGAPGAGHPYMMGFPGGVPMQMQQAQAQQYLANHRQPGMYCNKLYYSCSNIHFLIYQVAY